MVFAGIWQMEVAFNDISADGTSGFNARNLVYALQWWIFAAFGVWFWFRFLRDQRDAELHELEAAALAAPEQTHDMTASVAAEPEAEAVELISLDDSADRRRARAAQTLATDADQADDTHQSVEAGRESESEGTRS